MGKQADSVYEDLVARGKGNGTAKEWRSLVLKFEEANGEKEVYDRSDVIRYLSLLRSKYGHCQNTILKDLKPLRLLCEIQGWTGGFPKVTLAKVRAEDVRRTIFSYDDLVTIIEKAREVLPGRDMCYLALSVVYGMRREELGRLNEVEVKKGEVITVGTLKGGAVTRHLVPAEIKDYLRFYEVADTDYMTMVFERVVKKTGFKLVGNRWGWHSIRRTLATELLLREVSGINILRFMRWSEATIRGEFGMLTLYAKKDQPRVDVEVFKLHPFLEFFRK